MALETYSAMGAQHALGGTGQAAAVPWSGKGVSAPGTFENRGSSVAPGRLNTPPADRPASPPSSIYYMQRQTSFNGDIVSPLPVQHAGSAAHVQQGSQHGGQPVMPNGHSMSRPPTPPDFIPATHQSRSFYSQAPINTNGHTHGTQNLETRAAPPSVYPSDPRSGWAHPPPPPPMQPATFSGPPPLSSNGWHPEYNSAPAWHAPPRPGGPAAGYEGGHATTGSNTREPSSAAQPRLPPIYSGPPARSDDRNSFRAPPQPPLAPPLASGYETNGYHHHQHGIGHGRHPPSNGSSSSYGDYPQPPPQHSLPPHLRSSTPYADYPRNSGGPASWAPNDQRQRPPSAPYGHNQRSYSAPLPLPMGKRPPSPPVLEEDDRKRRVSSDFHAHTWSSAPTTELPSAAPAAGGESAGGWRDFYEKYKASSESRTPTPQPPAPAPVTGLALPLPPSLARDFNALHPPADPLKTESSNRNSRRSSANGSTPGAPIPSPQTSHYAPPRTPAQPQLDSSCPVKPWQLPDFVYQATPDIIAEAQRPDAYNPDEDRKGARKERVTKKRDEKIRRDAFKAQLALLVSSIPGLNSYAETRKATVVYARDYLSQIQSREKKLRAQLIAQKMKEAKLVKLLEGRGVDKGELEKVLSVNLEAPADKDATSKISEEIESLLSNMAFSNGVEVNGQQHYSSFETNGLRRGSSDGSRSSSPLEDLEAAANLASFARAIKTENGNGYSSGRY